MLPGLFSCLYGAGAGFYPFTAPVLLMEEKDMPTRPRTPCKHPGCPKLVPYGERYCEEHSVQHTKERGSAARRGYDARWRRERKIFLQSHPLCVKCLEKEKLTRATVVDHIIPHRGDKKLFWDHTNWQALCKHHHDQKTRREDQIPSYHY